ncbi:hypothetical protein QBC46DRAFT_442763 [Diplogelasinospora grovesii]|uniref:Uncharacterized protein n=1 Tax=Diplogelasinospora grovesii TaxID=303347 RepID=A0AAN6S1G5_9PEZI|nr:hypothetical protein QBC46DRAFT_442763 [Diplogelasinospora grovesii]
MTAPVVFSPTKHMHVKPHLAALHSRCITGDHTIATLLPPLNSDKLLNYWKTRIDEVESDQRIILMLTKEPQLGKFELMGMVSLLTFFMSL